MRVGMIGLGAIGGAVLDAARAGRLGEGVDLVRVLVRRPRPEEPLATADPAAFLAARPEVVLEAAGHEALRRHAVPCLEAGADLVLTSAGALVDDAFRLALERAAARAGRRIVVASAGIGALDILGAAAVGGLARVRVTVRKDPSAWWGTPAERMVDLSSLREPAVVYEGPVREGARLYPQNVNIAAAAALAGAGLDATELVIVADPTIREHRVEIEAEGAFGRFRFEEAIRPSAENPKTGVLVAMAVVKSLRRLAAPLVVGD
ncbi:MAG: aspartate dehydrogenase [Geminicoccaceae bacterium]|nr:aspartate dehydrogenase [Geminicoccaceae bacterium]